MNQRLRLPPYGAPRTPAGPGAILQQTTVGNVAGAFPAIPSPGPTEVSSDMASTDMRATLTDVASDSILRVKFEGYIQADNSWAADGTLILNAELLRGAGAFGAVAGNVAVFPVNVQVPAAEADPAEHNIMRHRVNFEADILASDIPLTGTDDDTFTLRWMAAPEAGGLALETLGAAARINVTLCELAPEDGTSRGLRRPSAGPYRLPISTGAVAQEAVVHRPVGVDVQFEVEGTELSGGAQGGVDMRPGLVPLRDNPVMRVRVQIVAMGTADWTANDALAVSLQISDDAGANWVQLGLGDLVLPPSIAQTGEPDVANAMRWPLEYEAEVPLLTAFPDYDGSEIIARATCGLEAEVALGNLFLTNEGVPAATWIKLQELSP